jgi:hypothetical protein
VAVVFITTPADVMGKSVHAGRRAQTPQWQVY